MEETHAPESSGASVLGDPAQNGTDPRKQEFARTLQSKVAQGYEIESQSDTRAVLVMKSRRRMFGLSNKPSNKTEIWIDETGQARSRGL